MYKYEKFYWQHFEEEIKEKTYCDTRTMGVNIDKNEYYEIKLSNSAHPEDAYKKSWHLTIVEIN